VGPCQPSRSHRPVGQEDKKQRTAKLREILLHRLCPFRHPTEESSYFITSSISTDTPQTHSLRASRGNLGEDSVASGEKTRQLTSSYVRFVARGVPADAGKHHKATGNASSSQWCRRLAAHWQQIRSCAPLPSSLNPFTATSLGDGLDSCRHLSRSALTLQDAFKGREGYTLSSRRAEASRAIIHYRANLS